MFPNLEAEMARSGVSRSDVARVLGKSYASTSRIFREETATFSVADAIKLKESFFDDCSIEYLFKEPGE